MLLHDLKRRVVLAPNDAEARFALGEALYLDGQIEPAIAALEKAIALDPDHGNARRLLARAYKKEGRLVPAERTLEEAVKRAPKDAAARDDLADVMLEIGRADDALLHLEEAIAVDPDDTTRRVKAAAIARRRQLLDRARRHLEHAQRVAPNDPDVMRELADIRLEQGDVVGACLSPLHRGTEFLIGRARADLDRPELRSELASSGVRDVVAKLRQGDVAGAKRAVVMASAAQARGAALDWLKAEIALLSGDHDRARDAFARCAQAHPQLGIALSRLAELQAARGDHRAAAATLRSLLGMDPKDADAHEALGDALAAAGASAEALKSWQRALRERADPILAAKVAAARGKTRQPEPSGTVGVVGALGWNAFGGVVSIVEAVAVPGKGELVFTGNVGKTGSEAAKVAHSCLKARAEQLGIADAIAKNDLHIHFVDTELAKDGPSAGVALALAGLSALTRRPLVPDLAASGEITLQGAIRPVGGLHEKIVAAYLRGIKTVIMPRKNLFEARELPREATDRIASFYVDSLPEAVEHAFL